MTTSDFAPRPGTNNGTNMGGTRIDRNWFDDAKLGMFVHWDHASRRGWEVSWPLVGGVFSLPYCQKVGVNEYHALAATFDPQAWDPTGILINDRLPGGGDFDTPEQFIPATPPP